MATNPQLLLPLALVAVYLIDTMHFLSIGDVLLSTRGPRIQRLSFGAAFELSGYRPFLPNPLTPFWPELRARWDLTGGAAVSVDGARTAMLDFLRALRPIGIIASICCVLICVVAPLALVFGWDQVFLAAAASCFATSIGGSIFLLSRRRKLGLTRWQAYSTSLISLVCLPCSANLARTVASYRRWVLVASDLIMLPTETGSDRDNRKLVQGALLEAQRFAPADSNEYRLITAQLQLLGPSR